MEKAKVTKRVLPALLTLGNDIEVRPRHHGALAREV
jgi:hypothetical protein